MSHADGVRYEWARIVRWLVENAPASAQALNPPATDADLQRLSDHLGFGLPEVLETWLRQNNGSTAKDSRTAVPGGFRLVPHADSRIFPGGEVFLDCQSIIDRHGNHLRIADHIGDEDWWQPSWIPVLAEVDAHYGLVLDAGQRDGSVPVLAYRETDYPKRYAASLEELLAGVADMLEHGRGDGVLTRGRYPFVQDGRVVWD
ncbi:SMI1/KNR4 family protein [Streptomyces blattellae]|uniref:SMI1/KNR4 family protein n=1 Tax=Streptomyces blattellae TaxID=2569855 RepID=UPI0012B7DAEF|nr:SMI1/KNR4 family protein [Streptomyces blattellae]